MSVQIILYCIDHITGVHKKDAKFVAEILFSPMNDLDTEKKIVDLHMVYGASVCRKTQKILKVVYTMLSCIVGAVCLKGGHIFRK